ncbi:hypothetical protein VQL36_16705 [Chengkuizengella sp. SCS-71B]|uniref:hypothetical protein n=1 Tax=Chengkuizengella sp. SCS-71B TaxID=3115290 RepID=UPI0032C223D9
MIIKTILSLFFGGVSGFIFGVILFNAIEGNNSDVGYSVFFGMLFALLINLMSEVRKLRTNNAKQQNNNKQEET